METRIRETWLTRKPQKGAYQIATLSTLFMILFSLIIWHNVFGWGSAFVASREALFVNHEWYRAWTTSLQHADFGHLFSNALLFFVFGVFLNGHYGLLLFPFLAFVFGGITNIIVLLSYGKTSSLVGASGIVYWMGGAWLVLYLLIDRRRSVWQRVLRSVGVAILLFLPSQAFDPSISYRAHAVGFVLGVFTGAIYFRIHRKKFRAAEVIEFIPEETLNSLDSEADENPTFH